VVWRIRQLLTVDSIVISIGMTIRKGHDVVTETKIAKTATEGVRSIWEDGWFSTWRLIGTIIEELANRGNHFSSPELGMALKRASYLTRRGNPGRFEYIQKFPYRQERMVEERGTKGNRK